MARWATGTALCSRRAAFPLRSRGVTLLPPSSSSCRRWWRGAGGLPSSSARLVPILVTACAGRSMPLPRAGIRSTRTPGGSTAPTGAPTCGSPWTTRSLTAASTEIAMARTSSSARLSARRPTTTSPKSASGTTTARACASWRATAPSRRRSGTLRRGAVSLRCATTGPGGARSAARRRRRGRSSTSTRRTTAPTPCSLTTRSRRRAPRTPTSWTCGTPLGLRCPSPAWPACTSYAASRSTASSTLTTL
mmetsp:Transcript_9125/g.24733  ORF Transcript_9125/g.24733 Transcript_9125/m.24733 type:complete len:249 (+) Transcript_9125:277-1023(+)